MDETSRRTFLLTAGGAVAALSVLGQDKADETALLARSWTARWICAPQAPPQEFGVYHFRRAFDLPSGPDAFPVHASGDNRYQLFVNGHRVAWGPARGSLSHWHFESVDLAPYLKAGRNVLAAVIWNFAGDAPLAQISCGSAFLLQGGGEAERLVNTGPGWKAIRNEAYAPIHVSYGDAGGYYAAGPGERLDGARYPWDWQDPEYDDSAWPAAVPVAEAAGFDARESSRWMLVPRSIPLMEEKPERIGAVRRSEGPALPAGFPASTVAAPIPPHTKATYLLDQAYLTTGYPELIVSGGRGASIRLSYAESLREEGSSAKGNRNEIEGKKLVGYHDLFLPDGSAHRPYRPLWWRTWRYIELAIETAAEPLTIEDLRSTYAGYPFQRKAWLETDDPGLARIQQVAWRTSRLCAHETFMDCPYYEQLQYVGDTRIQALISLYNTGDARLMRNAIGQIDDSRISNGATMSRYPTRLPQFIPSFSLWWIGMVHDYWRYVDDPDFVRRMLPGVRGVLSFFSSHQKRGGLLGPLPWWRFMDWAEGWQNGNPPQEAGGESAPFDLLHVMALTWAADLEAAHGIPPLAAWYRRRAAAVAAAAQHLYWDPRRRLYADTPRKTAWSQHTNALAVLSGVAPPAGAAGLIARVLRDPGLTQCSLYFRHYLYTALNQVGEGDRYLAELADWYTMIDKYGLTTFSEVLDEPGHPSRSDCHAWSASPNYELFHTVLGVDSAGPHFSRVLVRPFLGPLKRASGSMPHPKGAISVTLERAGASVKASISLPPGTPGEFVWKGMRWPLRPGRNRLTFQAGASVP
jgi:alpha-L-rhamnosidase